MTLAVDFCGHLVVGQENYNKFTMIQVPLIMLYNVNKRWHNIT